jgi:hypothetical protein
MKNWLKGLLTRLLGIDESPDAALWVPPGHFYSPIANLDDLAARADRVFDFNAPVAGIDFHFEDQRRLFEKLAGHAARVPMPEHAQPGLRYHWGNDQFGPGDALIFAAMLLEHRPRRVIEIGSGYSSALLLDVRDKFLAGAIDCTFIEPYPDRLNLLLSAGDKKATRLIQQRIELVDPAIVDDLGAGDILFVDSSHVAKAGSDVNHIVFTLLPRLKPGVLIHVHDIFYPFEYPREWFFRGNRSWNEAYLLRAFLTDNPHYRIVFFNHAFAVHFPAVRGTLIPDFWRNPGGSIWLIKK